MSKFNVGDKVVCNNDGNTYIAEGNLYNVLAVDVDDNTVMVKDCEGDNAWYGESQFDAYHQETPAIELSVTKDSVVITYGDSILTFNGSLTAQQISEIVKILVKEK